MEYIIAAALALLVFAASRRWIRNRAQQPNWRPSDNGNATAIVGSERITVFQGQYGDWKYCIADTTDPTSQPYFSDSYLDEDSARMDATLHVNGQPLTQKTVYAKRAERRAERAEASAAHLLAILDSIDTKLAKDSEMLTRQEAKAEYKSATVTGIARRVMARQTQLSKLSTTVADSALSADQSRRLIASCTAHDTVIARVFALMKIDSTPPKTL